MKERYYINIILTVLTISAVTILLCIYSYMFSIFDESVKYDYQRGDSRITVTAEIINDTFKIESVLEQKGKETAYEKIHMPLSQAYSENLVTDFYIGLIRHSRTIKTDRVLAELFLRSREKAVR